MSSLERWQLKQRQGLPLELKERLTAKRIKEWYEYWDGNVYVSFSGGKDSTVLLHTVRNMYPDVPAVFVDTGLEFPEIREFIKSIDNVEWLKPRKNFKDVIWENGYPVVSKAVSQMIEEIRTTKSDKLRNKRLYGDEKGRGKLPNKWKYLLDSGFLISGKCCYIMKKSPFYSYERSTGRTPFMGLMASDSDNRQLSLLRTGCNSFNNKRPCSRPLGFWMEEDIWSYIHKYNLDYSKIYDMDYKGTGCMFCMFGLHLTWGKNRFQLMRETHPKQHAYCINKLGCGEVLRFMNISY